MCNKIKNKLKISVWNANGLVNHGLELKSFIVNQNLDVMLISETHMTNKSFIKVPDFNIYHTQHPNGTARGGTAIIIKKNIKHHEIAKVSQKNIQATSVIIDDGHGPLTLSAVYCPPNLSIKKEQFEAFFNSLGHRFIAGGDYNAKHTYWGSRLITPRGRQLYQSLQSCGLLQLSSGEPTYWPTDQNKVPDVIDFCITKGISHNYLKIESCLDLSSDHTPLLVTLDRIITKITKPPTLFNKYTNWETFKTNLSEQLNLHTSLKTKNEIDEAVEHLTVEIQQAAWNATPQVSNIDKPGYCPEHIKKEIIIKRKLRQRWQLTQAPSDKTNLNKATKKIKKLLDDHKNEGVRNFLENLSASEATDYSLWKVAKKVKEPQKVNQPVKKSNGTWARNDEEKAEAFVEHLVKVFQPPPRQIPSEHEHQIPSEDEHQIHQLLEAPYQMSLPIKKFKMHEIEHIIFKKINAKKAPGYDLITGKVLQNLPKKGFKLLRIIFNAIVTRGYFPSQWKVAQVIMIQKPGKDPTETSSYRPISLLPILSKIFEKLLLKRLLTIIEERNLIPDHQFGFRQGHGTVEQVHRVVKKIRTALECKRYCSAAFLDISQAFDRVWHLGLMYKIKKNLPHPFSLLLDSYLTDRYFLIKYGETYTTLQPILSGVPQGSVLGPLLYLLYTSDLPVTENTESATYADDTGILASDDDPHQASRLLQTHLNKIEIWLKTWRITANTTKSVHITFTLRRGTCPSVTLYGKILPVQESVKYLGFHLDRRLTWAKHIWSKRLQLGLVHRKMYWLMGHKSPLSIENKVLLYKTILKPIWTYGIQLWGAACDSNIERIQRFQNKVLRSICNAPWYVTNYNIATDLQVDSIKEVITSLSKKYQLRLSDHPNVLACDLLLGLQTRRLKRYDPTDLPRRT